MHKAIIKCKTCQKCQSIEAESVALLIGDILHGMECQSCRAGYISIAKCQPEPETVTIDYSWATACDRGNPQ